ncbi:hypothetical protein L7F22_029847 [Adiantum nelumboides]|nr:hypothetical protein [Adiantum nelumboides]
MYAANIDFEKAYDTVQHEALFLNMEAAGIGGRAMNYFRALYQSSKVKVRVGAKLNQEVLVARGLRQGCPASPTLFNIFIDDILDESANDLGIAIPSLLQKIKGLLFVDYLVLLAE